MYTLIGSPKTRVFRVLWCLEELGLDYELEPAPPHSPAITAINPSGKVPALKDGDDVIIDSVAICQYLADKHGRLTHAAGTIARAQQDSWTQFTVDDVESPLWTNAKHSFVLPEDKRVPAVKPTCEYEFDRAMGVLGERLGSQTYVTGEVFTVPDLLLGHCGGWAVNSGWTLPEGTVADYIARVRSRPAFNRAMEIRDRS